MRLEDLIAGEEYAVRDSSVKRMVFKSLGVTHSGSKRAVFYPPGREYRADSFREEQVLRPWRAHREQKRKLPRAHEQLQRALQELLPGEGAEWFTSIYTTNASVELQLSPEAAERLALLLSERGRGREDSALSSLIGGTN